MTNPNPITVFPQARIIGQGPTFTSHEVKGLMCYFQIGINRYDTHYPDAIGYNNYYCVAFGSVAQMIQQKKFKSGSWVTVTAEMQYTKKCTEAPRITLEKENPLYGQSLFANGVRFDVRSMDYIAALQDNKSEKAENKPEKAKEAKTEAPNPILAALNKAKSQSQTGEIDLMKTEVESLGIIKNAFMT